MRIDKEQAQAALCHLAFADDKDFKSLTQKERALTLQALRIFETGKAEEVDTDRLGSILRLSWIRQPEQSCFLVRIIASFFKGIKNLLGLRISSAEVISKWHQHKDAVIGNRELMMQTWAHKDNNQITNDKLICIEVPGVDPQHEKKVLDYFINAFGAESSKNYLLHPEDEKLDFKNYITESITPNEEYTRQTRVFKQIVHKRASGQELSNDEKIAMWTGVSKDLKRARWRSIQKRVDEVKDQYDRIVVFVRDSFIVPTKHNFIHLDIYQSARYLENALHYGSRI